MSSTRTMNSNVFIFVFFFFHWEVKLYRVDRTSNFDLKRKKKLKSRKIIQGLIFTTYLIECFSENRINRDIIILWSLYENSEINELNYYISKIISCIENDEGYSELVQNYSNQYTWIGIHGPRVYVSKMKTYSFLLCNRFY